MYSPSLEIIVQLILPTLRSRDGATVPEPTIYSVRQATTTDEQKLQLLDLIERVPQKVVESMLWEMGELIQGWSTGESSIQARILAKTAALLDAAAKLPPSDNKG